MKQLNNQEVTEKAGEILSLLKSWDLNTGDVGRVMSVAFQQCQAHTNEKPFA